MYRITGAVGATIVSVGGFVAGALPVPEPDWVEPWRPWGLTAVYFGLTLMIAAWWWAGRDRSDVRGRVITLVWWAVPLAVAPPMFSRDVYSYAAQGAMVRAGLDVYHAGVDQLGGPLAAQVAPAWQHTPAPYGPVFLAIAKTGPSVWGMRLVAVAGLALIVFSLPRLAERCGVDPSTALWLGVLNPLVPMHLVAGAHNDALMLGLLAAGLTVALGQRYALATVLITLAALVKAPAIAGLLVVAVLWRSPWRLVATAGATTVVATVLAGTGFGWLRALGTPVEKHSWSLTSALGRMLGPAAMPWCLALGMVAAAVVSVWVWRERNRLGGPVYALGLILAAVALLGPATRPWYGLWGLIPLAAAASHGKVRLLAAVGVGILALLVLPSGFGPDAAQFALAAGGVGLGLAAAAVLWRAQLGVREREQLG